MKLYGYTSIDRYLGKLAEKHGYECINIDEGCLTSGDWVCLPPDDNHYVIVIREVPISSQSSGQSVRKYRTLPKKYKEAIDRHEREAADDEN